MLINFVKEKNIFIYYMNIEYDLEYDLDNKLSGRENERLPYYFIFTRHGFSCNNSTDTSGWFKKQINVLKKVLEPHLTDYGIVKTIAIGQKNAQKYNSTTVFVSCLLRTWETAVLLYLPNLGLNDNLNIVVSPFLKEKHGTFKRGNYPNVINKNGVEEMDIVHTIDNFIVFLKLLNTNYTHYFNEKKLKKIMVIYNGKSYSMSDVFLIKNSKNIFLNENAKKIGGNGLEGPVEQIIMPNQTQNTLVLTTECNPKIVPNYLYPYIGFNFYVNNSKENLFLFILWVTQNIKAGIFSSHNNEIHVVAHSNIMQSFIKIMENMINYVPTDIATRPVLSCSTLNNYLDSTNAVNELKTVTSQPLYNSIIKTNSWSIESLVTFTENTLNITISKMTTGVPKLKNTDPTLHELCSRVLNNQEVKMNNLASTSKSKLEFGGSRKKNKKRQTKRIQRNKRKNNSKKMCKKMCKRP
jgi:broad specificity phosphatase PhoE